MKLCNITESTKFHGTHDPESIMRRGLEFGHGPSSRKAVYLGGLSQALAYGPYVVEVQLDDTEHALVDEDSILMIADDNDDPKNPTWTRQIINLPPKLAPTLHKLAMQEGGWWPGFSKTTLADFIYKYKLKLDSSSEKTAGNVAVTKHIGFDGSNRIIAIYKTQKQDRAAYGASKYQITDVVYGAGSLRVGEVVIGSNEKLF